MGGLAFALLVTAVRSEPAAETAGKPVLTIALPSVDQSYDNLKYLFDVAGDQKGFKTFKDTLDTFAEGVQTDQKIGIRSYVTPAGLRDVASIPVKSEAEFKKFIHNLWDLDVKTAPPPTPSQLPQVTREAKAKLGKTKLQANERLIFGLASGYLRYDSGHVHIGESLDEVRMAHGGSNLEFSPRNILALEIDGQGEPAAKRREAIAKSRDEFVAKVKKREGDSAADLALKQQLVAFQFAKLELLLGDAARGRLAWTLSREEKHSVIEGQVSAVEGSALAKDIAAIGQSADKFSGISSDGTALAAAITFPADAGLAKALLSLTRAGRDVAREKIDAAKELQGNQKATDKALAELVFDVIDDVAGMPTFNGFVRTWANQSGSLTTVGAVAVSDSGKFKERVRKIPSSEPVEQQEAGLKGLDLHKVTATKWRKDYAELFDKEGSILIGVSDDAVWYATGDRAQERLSQAVQSAHGESGTKPKSAIDIHVHMGPIAHVWDAIGQRQPAGGAANKAKDQADKKDSKKLSDAASNIGDLQLHKVAAEAFRSGNDEISLILSRKGDAALLSIESHDGFLKFISQALSKFVKDNLED
jgi:hypothetical protein